LLIGMPATDPGVRPAWTLLMAAGTWPGAALLGFALLKNCPDRKALLLEAGPSALLFFLGALLGAVISGDNASVPAHYHATVGAVTLALMAAAPSLAKEAGLAWPQGRAARLQPWLFAAGALLLVAGFFVNGLGDAPRKMPGAAGGGMGGLLFGLGGALAVLAALLFCVLAGKALLKGTTAPRRDLRPLAAAATVGAIALAGAAIAFLPGYGPRLDPREQHVRDMKLREIGERFGQGVVMLHARRYEHALTAFHRVLELDPEMPEAHVNAGFTLLGMEKPGAARDFFLSAIELRPGQLNAYYGLAVAHERLGDLPAARGAMRTYAHLAPQTDPFRRKAEAALWEWELSGAKPR
jgi:tetratricopeptide (TPR) repeat protein